ncbi:hypothetical protein [Luteimonas saliphila]|uniref:hypothetical protein n=1 Tax=Luteimonas saliphila TaxID=2804919 RepID=UPI00192D450B|nr:hypothetical protein [Luteimonas saliphila]
MNAQPLYVICAEAYEGKRFAERSLIRAPMVVVTELEQLRTVPDGFAFHVVSPPSLELWAYVAEHGGADVAPHSARVQA